MSKPIALLAYQDADLEKQQLKRIFARPKTACG